MHVHHPCFADPHHDRAEHLRDELRAARYRHAAVHQGDWNDEGLHDCSGRFGRHRHGDGDFFETWNGLRGGGRRGGGRMFGHGDLKLLLLALIEQQPRHGYELIRTIEDMFQGQYSPSPGAIYPTLTMLEDMGYVEVQSEEAGRKRYAITGAGRAFLDENRDAVEAVTERTERSARMAAKFAAPMAIRKAMHELKYALMMRSVKWNRQEAERVISILEHAARDIAAGKSAARDIAAGKSKD